MLSPPPSRGNGLGNLENDSEHGSEDGLNKDKSHDMHQKKKKNHEKQNKTFDINSMNNMHN